MKHTVFFGHGRILVVALACVAPALGGCSSNEGLKKQVKSMETQLTAMRADQDRMEERLAAMELASNVPKRDHDEAPAAAARVEHPRLKVIHLGPEDEDSDRPSEPPAAASPESGGRRPIIRGSGDRVIKLGDADSDETTRNDGADGRPVAQLGRESRGN
ncbi:MAG TPA: hypothetical protein VHE30_06275 [Polyangiaceae bacterium]|nr:hypothetical protein [Polyangiaceae bacterium]